LPDLGVIRQAVRCHRGQGTLLAIEIDTGKAAQLQAVDLSATRTLEELQRIAFFDPAGCFDAAGNLLPLAEMPPDVRAAVASVKVVKRNLTEGDARVDEVYEVTFCDKVRALEQLAEHFGLLVERVEHQGSVGRERGRVT
jgi:hypothetical protein